MIFNFRPGRLRNFPHFNFKALTNPLFMLLYSCYSVSLLLAMEEKLLYKIHIRGYVQGVGYRWSAVREARILSITGFVRNMPDGSVYIEAEGHPRKLRAFLDWCHKGPSSGFVESVETESSFPVNYIEFRIEY